ncbi:hypothetical protein L593_12680 [Salinarchaeum sp. Harcht-Bsk1]|uniref:DUF7855 family protein n=1 Tax=Salinarchaeum sp. Harcht-Bsk1 TaxID=1333523 RepID=UPI00034247EB|nr:hypothetical protein [Salinarchaeum sp. Harcht-Bsk1]AGN02475.1 hypothetical protein L593_12680 [Salinarchaeum sp. Harcht-Bsk1]
MLLVVTYSRAARQTLRNVCNAHEETVVRRFGRAALLEETAMGAFLGLRLRAKHGADVQLERTAPFNEFEAVDADVRDAAAAYEARDRPSTPYAKFAAGTDHPDPSELRDRDVADRREG